MNYTQAQIDRANAVSLEDFLRTQGETLIKSGREYRWKEHDSLTVRGNKWFRHSQSKGGYRQKHESDFIIADAAARYFRENGISKLPSYKALQAEIESLIKEKNSGYNDYRAKREEYRRLQTVKGNIDQILRRSEPQRRKEQSHER